MLRVNRSCVNFALHNYIYVNNFDLKIKASRHSYKQILLLIPRDEYLCRHLLNCLNELQVSIYKYHCRLVDIFANLHANLITQRLLSIFTNLNKHWEIVNIYKSLMHTLIELQFQKIHAITPFLNWRAAWIDLIFFLSQPIGSSTSPVNTGCSLVGAQYDFKGFINNTGGKICPIAIPAYICFHPVRKFCKTQGC